MKPLQLLWRVGGTLVLSCAAPRAPLQPSATSHLCELFRSNNINNCNDHDDAKKIYINHSRVSQPQVHSGGRGETWPSSSSEAERIKTHKKEGKHSEERPDGRRGNELNYGRVAKGKRGDVGRGGREQTQHRQDVG